MSHYILAEKGCLGPVHCPVPSLPSHVFMHSYFFLLLISRVRKYLWKLAMRNDLPVCKSAISIIAWMAWSFFCPPTPPFLSYTPSLSCLPLLHRGLWCCPASLELVIPLPQLLSVGITNVCCNTRQTRRLEQQQFISYSSGGWNFEMRCLAGWFLLRLLFLAFRWPPSSWGSHKPFLYVDLRSSLLLIKGHQSCWIGTTLMTLF